MVIFAFYILNNLSNTKVITTLIYLKVETAIIIYRLYQKSFKANKQKNKLCMSELNGKIYFGH